MSSRSRRVIGDLAFDEEKKEEERALPSPLVRRGADERAYLQRQLRAEAQALRRRQQQAAHRGEVLRVQRDHLGPSRHPQDHTAPASQPPLLSAFGNNGLASPPAILTEKKRISINDFLAQSRDENPKGAAKDEDNDNFVLFFPDGVPIDDGDREEEAEASSLAASGGECRRLSESELSLDSASNADEDQGSSADDSFDGGLGLGNAVGGGGAKKVLLRPKMTARANVNATKITIPPPPPLFSNKPDSKAEHLGGVGGIEAIPSDIDLDLCLGSPSFEKLRPILSSKVSASSARVPVVTPSKVMDRSDKPLPSSSFISPEVVKPKLRLNMNVKELALPSIGFVSPEMTRTSRNIGGSFSGMNHNVAIGQKHEPLPKVGFASPEITRKQSFCHGGPPPLKSVHHRHDSKLKEPLSESNYHTPDHSSSLACHRKRLALRRRGNGGGAASQPTLLLPSLGVGPGAIGGGYANVNAGASSKALPSPPISEDMACNVSLFFGRTSTLSRSAITATTKTPATATEKAEGFHPPVNGRTAQSNVYRYLAAAHGGGGTSGVQCGTFIGEEQAATSSTGRNTTPAAITVTSANEDSFCSPLAQLTISSPLPSWSIKTPC